MTLSFKHVALKSLKRLIISLQVTLALVSLRPPLNITTLTKLLAYNQRRKNLTSTSAVKEVLMTQMTLWFKLVALGLLKSRLLSILKMANAQVSLRPHLNMTTLTIHNLKNKMSGLIIKTNAASLVASMKTKAFWLHVQSTKILRCKKSTQLMKANCSASKIKYY